MELDNILSGKEAETPPVETPETPPVEAVETPPVETLPVEAKPDARKKEEPPLTERERAFLRKAEDETRKRQTYERQLQETQSKLPKETPKQFWDDPEGSLKSFETRLFNEITKSRLNTAEMVARSRYQDFEQVVEDFPKMMEENPALYQQWLNSQDPAEFAYKTVKNTKQLQDAGGIDKLTAKIEKETRLKIEAELKSKAEALEKEKASIPGTLSDVKGTAGGKVEWKGPSSLDEILGRA